jgi:Fur family peroxide stress response transcriptional regulator
MTELDARVLEMVTCLRRDGHRLTPQRMAILEILAESADHPSAEQIYAKVCVDFPMTSLATVYKTVTLLKEMGQILELGFSDDSNRYDGRQPSPHPHLVCVRCKRIVDSDLCALDGRLDEGTRQVAQQSGYQMVARRLDFFGICPRCQQEAL